MQRRFFEAYIWAWPNVWIEKNIESMYDLQINKANAKCKTIRRTIGIFKCVLFFFVSRAIIEYYLVGSVIVCKADWIDRYDRLNA